MVSRRTERGLSSALGREEVLVAVAAVVVVAVAAVVAVAPGAGGQEEEGRLGEASHPSVAGG